MGKYQLIHTCGARCGTVTSLAHEPGTPLSGYLDEQGLPHEPKRRLLCPKCQSPVPGAVTARRRP